jgi:hypothetical protein
MSICGWPGGQANQTCFVLHKLLWRINFSSSSRSASLSAFVGVPAKAATPTKRSKASGWAASRHEAENHVPAGRVATTNPPRFRNGRDDVGGQYNSERQALPRPCDGRFRDANCHLPFPRHLEHVGPEFDAVNAGHLDSVFSRRQG